MENIFRVEYDTTTMEAIDGIAGLIKSFGLEVICINDQDDDEYLDYVVRKKE